LISVLEDNFGAIEHLAMNYDHQWRDFRRRNRLWWFVFLGLIPGIILVGFALDLISPGLAERTSDTIFFFAWMAALLQHLSTPEDFVVHDAESDISERGSGVSTLLRESVPIAVCQNGLPTDKLQTETSAIGPH
jgi:hypothetical protein